MFEQKKVSHEEKKSVSTSAKPIKLNVPDITGLGMDGAEGMEEIQEETQEEEQIEEKKPFISMFKNLFGGVSAKETTRGCGCMGR